MKSTIDKEGCPPFDDGDNVEGIWAWAEAVANASVDWSDEFVNGKGERNRRPELAHWTFCWKLGFIGFCSLRENTDEDKRRARCASALFVYLYCRGIEASLACHLAEAYVNYYKIEE